ncbi:MAG: bifunctional 2',3'-cyclic-nucleotide 2'-phosphodiesterase/3'-nucleotidase [Dyella sp.]
MSISALRTRFSLLSLALLAGCASQLSKPAAPSLADGARAQVAILETTDIHSNVLSYDYYKQKADPTMGLERTATLIHLARQEFPNTFLFDDGDTIQGSVLADYQALVKPVGCDQALDVYRAMDAIGYDGGTIGNHEFNYGLGFLSQVSGTPMNVEGGTRARCAGPHYPLVLANVRSTRDERPIFQPWTVVQKNIEVYTVDGSKRQVPLRIGIIGFAPPPIMEWDKHNLQGKVEVDGVVEAARKYLPQLQAQHPDLIVALLHGGLDSAPYTAAMENAGWYLAGVPGIDVLLLGHVHTEFPGPHYADMPEVDAVHGLVRGKPAVMGGFFGKDLGVIELALNRQGGHWIIDPAHTISQVRPICAKPVAGQPPSCVAADPAIAPLLADTQAATVAYVNTPIGYSQLRMSSYFSDVGDARALAVINATQRDYVLAELPKQHPELAGVPVLSAAAAFRTGFGGADDYTDVGPGDLTLRSAADLYFYPNTLAAVKIDGATLKGWLEHAAQRYNHIDPSKHEAQALINSAFSGFNADQIQGGIRYQIDLTQPVGQRIVKLSYQGKPVTPKQVFVVVTNNYRAGGGGNFPGLNGDNIVLSAPDGTRELLVQWLKRHPQLKSSDLEPAAWRFAPLKVAGPVLFTSAAGKQDVARQAGLTNVRQVKDNGDGTASYAIDLGE